ncbi:hypothetical protein OG555_18625 [Kribbella sp. NBC_01484]|uniref:hypothetical protein n=1 Tax=Kribbella sp. NBC_01484 TaxID=2903579 RepID=UPI002E343C0E|nr:hypothetical protein [Kribbella sp. NBC_01484]
MAPLIHLLALVDPGTSSAAARLAPAYQFTALARLARLVAPHIEEDLVVDVRRELGFLDLVRADSADEIVVGRLTQTLPQYALERCDRWKETAHSEVASVFSDIRTASTSRRRSNEVDIMREYARVDGFLEDGGGW